MYKTYIYVLYILYMFCFYIHFRENIFLLYNISLE